MKLKCAKTETPKIDLFANNKFLGEMSLETAKEFFGEYEVEFIYNRLPNSIIGLSNYKLPKTKNDVIFKIRKSKIHFQLCLLTIEDLELLFDDETNL